MRSEGWIPGDSGSLEGGSAVATEFLGHSVGKGKIFIFCFLNIFSDPIPIFESGFDCNHSPVFSEFPVSVSLANSCNKFLCENRMNISIKFNMSVQIDFELFQSRVILFDAQKTFLKWSYTTQKLVFLKSIYFWGISLSSGCWISCLKMCGKRSSLPNVNDVAVTMTFGCSTWSRVHFRKVFASGGMKSHEITKN